MKLKQILITAWQSFNSGCEYMRDVITGQVTTFERQSVMADISEETEYIAEQIAKIKSKAQQDICRDMINTMRLKYAEIDGVNIYVNTLTKDLMNECEKKLVNHNQSV